MTDTQLAEFLQYKKSQMPQLKKLYAVSCVGPQEDGSWVLSPNAHISSLGEDMDVGFTHSACVNV